MNAVLVVLFGITITGWKLVGFAGGAGFALRWIVQARHRQKTGTAEIPTLFWIISLIAPLMVMSYFIFGKNDSVGVMSNLFPIFIASYNLYLDVKQRRAKQAGTTGASSADLARNPYQSGPGGKT